jgi:hypothetical protein
MRAGTGRSCLAAWTACAVLLAAAPAPAQVGDRTRVFDAPLDRVWAVARFVLGGRGWGIEREDRGAGLLRSDVRRTEGDDFGVYAEGVKHRLELRFKDLDGRTAVTVDHLVWREKRILWIDRRENLPVTDHAPEREILDAIGEAL